MCRNNHLVYRIGIPVLIAILNFPSSLAALTATVTVSTTQDTQSISPYIYGTNQTLSGTENFSAVRMGGNRMSGYNWENNASNAGADWKHSSDNYIPSSSGILASQALIPGIAVTAFIDSCLRHNQFAIATFQMAGYVARDKLGEVDTTQTAPSNRWCKVLAQKPTPFAATPDTTDSVVYMDEQLNFLAAKYISSSIPWLGGICLDNEPGIWVTTHPRLHVTKPTCAELMERSLELSTALKAIDEKPLVFGPVTYGFGAMKDFQGADDWSTVKGEHSWFVGWYLEQFKVASATAGKRLLDVFDMHWYPEARGNGERICFNENPTNRENAEARMQAPRTLWDKNYKEDSWIAEWNASFLPIIPKVKASIDTWYPGTKLGITEYNYGGESHISGGIATADVLGIYGKYGVAFGCYWKSDTKTDFTSAAFKLYRNYDGKNGTFGATAVAVENSDPVSASAYGSLVSATNNELHLILLNKNYDSTLTTAVTITSPVTYAVAHVWGFDSASSAITERELPVVTDNAFTYAIPRLTALHVVLGPATAVQLGKKQQVQTAPVRLYGRNVRYNFRQGEEGVVSLHACNGALLKQWSGLRGEGVLPVGGDVRPAARTRVLSWQSRGSRGAILLPVMLHLSH